jgi:hypothetical protein
VDVDSYSDIELIADRMTPATGWSRAGAKTGLADFCRLSAHRLDDPDFWTLLAIGRRLTGDATPQMLLDEIRVEWIATAGRPRPEVLERLDARHRRLRGPSRRRMARHIREHPADFPA